MLPMHACRRRLPTHPQAVLVCGPFFSVLALLVRLRRSLDGLGGHAVNTVGSGAARKLHHGCETPPMMLPSQNRHHEAAQNMDELKQRQA